MRLRLPCLLLALTGLAACGDTSPATGGLVTVDSAGVQIATITHEPASLPEWRLTSDTEHVITGAESGDSAALSEIGAVHWLADGGLVIADRDVPRLLLYDADGTYRGALGRRGAGPGELRNLTSVSVLPGDTLATFDGTLRRLSFWHPDAGFLRQITLLDGGATDEWPADARPWRDSLVVVLQLAITPPPRLTGTTVQRWPMRARLTLRDSAGRVLDTSPSFDGMYTGIHETGDTRLPFSHEPFVAAADDRLYFGSGDDFRITYLTPGFAQGGEIRWPSHREALTREEVERVYEETLALLTRRLPPERAREALAMSFHPEILPAQRPAIGRVLVDAEQRLWIERFEAVRLGARMRKPGDQWTVLASDGTPVARVVLPANVRLEAVRGDRVAVVRRDSLDVPAVAIHRLQR